MGEAKRRKQLDPDFGMPNGLKFLTREAEPTKAELKVIFDEFVPREVERAAFMFSFEASGNGYSLTPALQALVNDKKLDFDAAMLLRNGTTIDWVKAFIRESIAKHPRFAGLEERIQIRLATAIDFAIEPKVIDFWDLIQSGECEDPPTLQEFWEGKREHDPARDVEDAEALAAIIEALELRDLQRLEEEDDDEL